MQLKVFCQHYPEDQSLWPGIDPCKALPLHLREVLFARLGTLRASQDRSRAKASTRLGSSLREFLPGDRISALSLNHLLHRDELLSRVDDSQGQLIVNITLLGHSTLDYRGQVSTCTKGQVGLGIAGILAGVHTRQGHAVRFRVVTPEQFPSALFQSSRGARKMTTHYLISDYLYGSLLTRLEDYQKHGIQGVGLFCVRDPDEIPSSDNSLLQPDGGRLLADWEGTRPETQFSGTEYGRNLKAELDSYAEATASRGHVLRVFSENAQISAVLNALRLAYATHQPATMRLKRV